MKKIICLTILLIAAGICLLLGAKVQKSICDNVYILSFLQEDKTFSNSEISTLENKDIQLTYVKYLYPEISSEIRMETAAVIATNSNYSYFTKMEIISGAFFNHVQADQKLSVVVLNEAAAYQFFGNYDCVGENLYLDNKAFKVIGIVTKQEDQTEAKIYVPDTTTGILENAGGKVEQLWCQFVNMAEASEMVGKMGYFMDEMNIVQMDLYKKVFYFRCFLVFMLISIKYIVHGVKSNLTLIKEKKWYFMQNRKCVAALVLMMFLLFAFRIVWCVPSFSLLTGKSGINLVYDILEFYTLSGFRVREMNDLNHWNLLSLLGLTICCIGAHSSVVNRNIVNYDLHAILK